jgi:hypothetical protein
MKTAACEPSRLFVVLVESIERGAGNVWAGVVRGGVGHTTQEKGHVRSDIHPAAS